MYLSKEDSQEDLPKLQKKMHTIQQELKALLDKLGMDRSQFDTFMSDPSHFTGADWNAICHEMEEFKKTLDLITFSSGKDELQKKREEMKAQSHWMSKRHPS
jgi:hypothetical protein